MKKILTSASMREVDAHTLRHLQIEPIVLMEQAARACVEWICTAYNVSQSIVVWCGKGNNGGDGLAIARLLHQRGYSVVPCIIEDHEATPSPCFLENLSRLPLPYQSVRLGDVLFWQPNVLCIDAILGSGVTRPVTGTLALLFEALQDSTSEVVAVDIPSGIPADGVTQTEPYKYLKANHTLVLHLPKPVLYDPTFTEAIGVIHYVPIGLSEEAIQQAKPFGWELDLSDLELLTRARPRHAHKGIFGHALVVAGGYGKMGAAFLTAKAGLRSGAGKVSCAVPKHGNLILQSSLPEAMTLPSNSKKEVDASFDPTVFDAIVIGPGIGQGKGARNALLKCLSYKYTPLVIDADAIRLLASVKLGSHDLPQACVLTPHPGEADALFGPSEHYFERLSKAADFARANKAVVVLKGGFTAVIDTQGIPHFCTFGNPGMATAGSGDVLAGIIGALLAQGYAPFEAAKCAVLWHAHAGDCAAELWGEHSMIAGDIIQSLGVSYKSILRQTFKNPDMV